jgi:predicted P-loop ATPase
MTSSTPVGDALAERLHARIAQIRVTGRHWGDLSPKDQTAAMEACTEAMRAVLEHRNVTEQGRTSEQFTGDLRFNGFLSKAFLNLRRELIKVGELLGLEVSAYYVPAISSLLRVELVLSSRFREEHRQHLADELGLNGALHAVSHGARSIDADEAERLGFRYKGWRGGGLLLPFDGDFAQLRCDKPPIARDGNPVKYLNRKEAKQQPATFGSGEPTIATEGWKDALRLHLETGETVQALPGVTAWRHLAPSVQLLIYDSDAALNPAVWSQLISAGLEQPSLRLAFFPRDLAGDKGGACEFFNARGGLTDVKRWKARELLRELSKQWTRDLRVDWKAPAIRRLAALAAQAGFDAVATEQLVCAAARAIGVQVQVARGLMARAIEAPQPVPGETPRCPEEPTKQQLQEFLRQAHEIRYNVLAQMVEIDGKPADAIDLADSLLAHLYGIETTKQAARDTLVYLAKANPLNPIADYLTGLRQVPGLRLLSIEEISAAFGIAPDDQLSQELLARHLAGACRRGMEPGYKHDQMLILGGLQGQGKGEAIKALFSPDWYGSATRVANGLEEREFLTTLNSVWAFEFDECEKALLGRDAAEFKGFTSRNVDRYVQKYETVSKTHPRRSVLFGTSNETEILNDPTGSRRYWLIDVRNGSLDPAWIRQNRDSIWATVATWVEWGLENWLPPHCSAAVQAAERAAQARLSEPWEGPIARYLERQAVNGEGVAQEDLIRDALQVLEQIKVDRRVQMTVARIVTASDFRTHGGTVRWVQAKRRFAGGTPRSGYVPKLVPTATTCSDGSGSGWNGQKPWQNSALTSLFQPFQPKREEYKEYAYTHTPAAACTPGGMCVSHVGGFDAGGRNVWNGAEIRSSAIDLPVPTQPEQPGPTTERQGGTTEQLPNDGTPAQKQGGIKTVTQQVEQTLHDINLSPSHPEAACRVHARLSERGISLAQVEAALQGIKQRTALPAPFIAGEDDPAWGPRTEAA